jgi:hypothetical protein
MVKDMASAFTLPGRVMKGEVDLNTEEGLNEVNNFALNFGIGGLVTSGMKPGVGMFGGRMTSDAKRLADKLEAAGMDAGRIKEMTGLERAADGIWRREFSDAGAKLKMENFRAAEKP